jgi:hypothetical protein
MTFMRSARMIVVCERHPFLVRRSFSFFITGDDRENHRSRGMSDVVRERIRGLHH